MRTLLICLSGLVLLQLTASAASQIQGATQSGLNSRSGSGASYAPAFSGDGRFLVFSSEAKNLVTNDSPSPCLNIYVREIASGKTTLVSVNTNGLGGGNENSMNPSISSNGQFIVFDTRANNLALNDTYASGTYGRPDVYLRDLVTGKTTLVSVNTNGVASACYGSYRPVISEDGQRVFFASYATDLTPGTYFNGTEALLFARDLSNQQTLLVSYYTNQDYGQLTDIATVSPDGRFATFLSHHRYVLPWITNMPGDIFLQDMVAETTTWVSTNVVSVLGGAYRCHWPVMSADNITIAFRANRWDSTATDCPLFRFDIATQTTRAIPAHLGPNNAPSPLGISANGRFISYDDGTNVFVWDEQLQSNLLVSVNLNGTGPGNGFSKKCAISPDGHKVVFLSTASDLVTSTTNGKYQVYVRDLVAGTTVLVSVNTNGAASSADLQLIEPTISSDGNLVAFDSPADDLVPDDLNRASDVFVRDLVAGTTKLISECHPALSSGSIALSTKTDVSCISSNGRWLVFTSPDGNFVPGDTNGCSDVFVRDLQAGKVQGIVFGTNPAVDAVISAHGRYVAYTRRTTSDGTFFGTFGTGDVYRYDLETDCNELVSATTSGLPAGASSLPRLSPDGRYVAFQSRAGALVPQGNSTYLQIFVRDMVLQTNILISCGPDMNGFSFDSCNPVWSADGQWLMYQSSEYRYLFAWNQSSRTNLLVNNGIDFAHFPSFSPDSRFAVFGSGNIYIRDLSSNSVEIAVTNFNSQLRHPSISASGRYVVYQKDSSLILLDRETSRTKLININWKGEPPPAGGSYNIYPIISPDAQFVIYATPATNMVYKDCNNAYDIFVWDRLRNVNVCASANSLGFPANSSSTRPVLAADGRTVVFQSLASDLVEGDYNMKRDLFVLRLSAGDTDNDGMDDDWEMTYFGNLDRDGTGDFDNDGVTDKDEYLTGTSPANNASVFRALTVTPAAGGPTTILWPSATGCRYQVQFKNSISDPTWTSFNAIIPGNGGTASYVDNETMISPHQRFYRVVLANW